MFDSWDPTPPTVAWWVLGLGVVAVVVLAVFELVGAVILGVFLYYSMRPVHRWLVDTFGFPRVAASLTLLLFGLPILAVLGYAVLVAISELGQLVGQAGLEELETVLAPYVDVADLTNPRDLVSQLDERVLQLAAGLQGAAMWVLRIFVAFAVAYYLLREDDEIAEWADRSFPADYGFVRFMEGVDGDLRTIYVGNLITLVVTGVIAVVVYYLLDFVAPEGTGIAFPLLLGLLTAIATLIPAVGMKIVYVPAGLVLVWQAVTGDGAPWFPVLFFLVTFLVVDTFPDVFIRSYISKGDINMGFIMLGYVIGAVAFGWYGIFLAPIVLVLFLHFAHRVFPNLLDPAQTRLVTDDWPE